MSCLIVHYILHINYTQNHSHQLDEKDRASRILSNNLFKIIFIDKKYKLSEDLVLVTNNEKEFQRIQSLKVENWSR